MTQPSLIEIRDAIRSGQTSSREYVQTTLQRIEQLEHRLGMLISHDAERALAQAEQIDAKIARGEPVGELAGVPILIKDNLCTRFGTTTAGSRILENYRAPYDAHVVERLQQAGAVIVGKTNLDEFAMGSSTENSAFKPTRNPWDLERVPGGSSGGSAAAVAAGVVAGTLGSDTGGSIRQPAAFCGVCGLKPTYGRVSRYGLLAYGSSLDQIGPFARNVRDLALLLHTIAGKDHRDSTSVDEPVPDYVAALDRPLRRMRIGYAEEYFGEGLDPEVRAAVEAALDVYRAAGAEVVPVHLPHMKYAIACYYVVAVAEASSNLARYDGVHYGHRTARPKDYLDVYCSSRQEGFGAEVRRRIMLGTYALSSGYYDAYYLKALKVRTLIRQDFEHAFADVDVIASPTTPTPAVRIGEKTSDPLAMYLMDIYTVSVNLAGIPGLSIPCGFTRAGLPIGLQLMGSHFAEEKLLRIAHEYQSRTDWHTKSPALAQP
ncbi:MAG TPA: Asp-tRNA(Asn)/Glu-tRNA(Gln) amidotransferase subunit GatA [Phycisphaerae bacterium]|nr:Asp-tRNA(Asn)/Glu-tRNA(Gln) amidotransferase subunit GatA [Phycisphaerae bacterium]HOJ75470.1 Asp-tRNA(Asn)/Glu-tRNA(Gln) amidotransferase subunit GatA [Phycisphaerae bacterium]HOM52270.1 Asp-tRNA(Asn)/Glu-tRNA(Gln) amidotransferase subunit GatA [Phycisphaerae bacterium]HOQ86924.1 Asp-tRNA(Asn)/Glu-tRNA(Gln) amidotransferase subunit GatA [Phycisphaerae bacterium]HPP24946.1 Asp-tRNA(Asn)/Glu-tRNA(Gln) amidotransferase subunit GatA [Phycisphaerae bacterium]